MPRIRLLLIVLALAGCATGRPVLAPNVTVELGGPADANEAVDQCLRQAIASGAHDPAGEIVTHTLAGAVHGAIEGAIFGHWIGEGRDGARLGAALGAADGLFHGLAHAAHPDHLAQAWVERCLAASGYEVLGWR